MPVVTIAGGNKVKFLVKATEVQAAQDALAKMSGGFESSVVLNSPSDPIPSPMNPDRMDVYNIPGSTTQFKAPAGTDAVVVSTKSSANIAATSTNTAHPESILMIGSGATGGDTIKLTGAGSIIGGGGADSIFGSTKGGDGEISIRTGANNDTITLAGKGSITSGGGADKIVVGGQGTVGSGYVNAGAGNDYIRVQGDVTVDAGSGNDSIVVNPGSHASINTGAGKDTVYVVNADATVTNEAGSATKLQLGDNSGDVKFFGYGTDKIVLGAGNDTIIEAGSATIKGGTGVSSIEGGAGQMRFTGDAGTDSVTAGSGSATMIAGSGNTVFTAGSGSTSMKGGTGDVTMAGGSGNETMVAGSKSSLFSFDSTEGGGKTLIRGFQDSTVPGVKSTQLEFTGYGSPSDIVAHSEVVGKNTIITLDDGTQITLKGFTTLGTDDIKS